MSATKNTIKNWFITGAKPIQAQFWAWMDSYWHKDEKIPITAIEDIEAILDLKADKDALQNGTDVYNGISPTTVSVYGLAANTNITGMTSIAILERILTPFQNLLFTSFFINGQNTIIECGEVISGLKTFDFSIANANNVQPNTLQIVNDSTVIQSGLAVSSPRSVEVPTIAFGSNGGSTQFTARVTDTKGTLITSLPFIVTAFNKIFYGNVANFPTTSAAVRALSNSLFSNQNNFTTPVVSTTKFTLAIPAYKDLISVITANNESLTLSFTRQTIENAGGALLLYKIYNYESVIPLNLKLNITVS
jgi:hypothetical protein